MDWYQEYSRGMCVYQCINDVILCIHHSIFILLSCILQISCFPVTRVLNQHGQMTYVFHFFSNDFQAVKKKYSTSKYQQVAIMELEGVL